MLVGTTLGVGCMKILITGAKGQLGTDLVKKMRENHDVFPYSSQELDITKLQKFDAEVEKIAPDIIINCAAFTDVDGCESNIERAYLVNSIGAKNCAIISNKYSLKLFHISTDYIFNGESEIPYKEDDIPEPISTYGKSKLSGEINIINHCNKFFILRTAGVYGANGNNFIKTILKKSGIKIKSSLVILANSLNLSTKPSTQIMQTFIDIPHGNYPQKELEIAFAQTRRIFGMLPEHLSKKNGESSLPL